MRANSEFEKIDCQCSIRIIKINTWLGFEYSNDCVQSYFSLVTLIRKIHIVSTSSSSLISPRIELLWYSDFRDQSRAITRFQSTLQQRLYYNSNHFIFEYVWIQPIIRKLGVPYITRDNLKLNFRRYWSLLPLINIKRRSHLQSWRLWNKWQWILIAVTAISHMTSSTIIFPFHCR